MRLQHPPRIYENKNEDDGNARNITVRATAATTTTNSGFFDDGTGRDGMG